MDIKRERRRHQRQREMLCVIGAVVYLGGQATTPEIATALRSPNPERLRTRLRRAVREGFLIEGKHPWSKGTLWSLA